MIDGPRLGPKGHTARSLVILLHGYGSNGDDLISLAPMLQSILPDAAFVAPDAPIPCPGTAGGFQWWPIRSFSMPERTAGATAAAPGLDAFISGELERHGLAEDRLLLIGFSQGTMMALHVGVRRPNPVAGIIGFSGMLVAPDLLESDVRSRPPILLVHGDADPVVPFGSLADARRALDDAGFSVEQHVSPGLGHNIDQGGIEAAMAFARAVLPG